MKSNRIEIITEQVVERGVPKYKIVSIKNIMPQVKLPLEYIDNGPHIYGHNDTIYFHGQIESLASSSYGSIDILTVGNVYSKKEFITIKKIILYCGNRLKEINDKVRELKKTWNKKKTFYI